MISLFLAGFVSVFLLGFQSRLVNTGNYLWAGGCSFTIAIAQVQLWSMLSQAKHSLEDGIVYGLSGFAAITCAMFLHKKVFKI